MPYSLNPEQRTRYAQQRIDNRTANATNYTSSLAVVNENIPEAAEVEEEDNVSGIQRVAETFADLIGNVFVGASKGIEGLYDFGATIVGGVAGLVGNKDLQSDIKENVSQNWTEENITNSELFQNATDNSYIYELSETGQNIIRGVTQGVGQMLPAVAITAATGGLGAPAALAQGAGLVTMGISAAGSATEEAFNEGADYNEGMAYGLLSGALEVATEKLVGGAFDKVVGKGVLDKAITSVLRKATTNKLVSKGLKIALEAGGEGLEEVVSEVATPYLKRLTYDKDAENASTQDILESFTIGALTDIGYRGSMGQVNAKSLNVSESIQEYNDVEQKASNLQAKGEDVSNVANAKATIKQEISNNLVKMTEKKRAKVLESNTQLQSMFEADGTVKATTASTVEYNKNNYSAAQYGEENKIDETLKAISTDLTAKTGKESTVSVYDGNIANTDEFTKMKKSINAISRKSGLRLNFVVVDSTNESLNGVAKENTLYITKNEIENGDWAKTVVHETTHFTEGTKEYYEYAGFVYNALDDSVKSDIQSEIVKLYGVSQDEIDGFAEAVKNNTLTKGQKTYLSELTAKATEKMLGDEQTIARLCEDNTSLAKRIYNKIKAFITSLTKSGANDSQLKQLKTAEKLYSKALSEAGNNVNGKTVPQFSIKNGIVIIDTDQNIFKGINKDEYSKVVKQYIVDRYKGVVVSDVKINSISAKEYTYSKSTQALKNSSSSLANEIFTSKMKASTEIDNFIATGEFIDHEEAKHPKYFNTNGYDRYSVTFVLDNNSFSGEMLIANSDKERIFYDIVKIKKNVANQINGGVNTLIDNKSNNDSATNTSISNSTEKSNTFDKKSLTSEKTTQKEPSYSLSEKKTNKTYTKKDAESIINNVMSAMEIGDSYGVIKGKTKTDVIEKLYESLNTAVEGEQIKVALNIADYLIDNTVLESIYADTENETAIDTVDTLKDYLHRIDLTEIKDEIKSNYGADNSVNLLWGKRKGTDGISLAKVAEELNKYGVEITATTPINIIRQVQLIYKNSIAEIKTSKNNKLKDFLGDRKRADLRQSIARELLGDFDNYGSIDKLAKMLNQKTEENAKLKEFLKNSRNYNAKLNSVLDTAQKIKDLKNAKYENASVLHDDRFKKFQSSLGRIKYRSDINKTSTREIIREFADFYNTKNEALEFYIDSSVTDAIDYILKSDEKKALSYEEMEAVDIILKAADHLFKEYDLLISTDAKEKSKITVTETANSGVEIIEKIKTPSSTMFGKILSKVDGALKQVIEPRVVFEQLDGYHEKGVFSKLFKDLTDGENEAGRIKIELKEPLDGFLKDHKGYEKRLVTETINLNGRELPVGVALSLYMTAQQDHALAGLEASGFGYYDTDRKWINVGKHTQEAINALKEQFTALDKDYIKLVRKSLDNAGEIKKAIDIRRTGFTNIVEGADYYPITRYEGSIAKDLADNPWFEEVNTVNNLSINKERIAGAKNMLKIQNIYDVLDKHIKVVSLYGGLSIPIDNFNRVYNKNIGSENSVLSMRTFVNENVWKGTDSYIKKYLSDIQGNRAEMDFVDKAINVIRSNYAKFQLGANLKSILSQTASFPTAFTILDADTMLKAWGKKVDYKAMDKYCATAKLRDYEGVIVKAQGVIDKLGKIGNTLTKPLQLMDRFTTGHLWNACQLQIEKTMKLAYGTEANKIQAGILLDEVIRKTQSNYVISERSGLMRSKSEIAKSFTMFSADAVKQLSRIVESFGRYNALKWRIRNGETTLSAEFNKAKKGIARTCTAVTMANIMYVLIAQFIKWLYDKDREEDEEGNEISVIEDMAKDFVSSTVGMLPFIRDIYDMFIDGYDIENFAYSTINDIVGSTDDLITVVEQIASGEATTTADFMKPFRNSLYALGQLTGIPIRNINNTVSGLIKRVSPETAYKYNSMFTNAQYTSDLNKAVEAEDYGLANTIVTLLMGSNGLEATDSTTAKLVELYEQGYSVLPKTADETLTYNSEEYTLTNKELSKFKSIYGQSTEKVTSLVGTKAFTALDSATQAKAIKFVYDYYYEQAIEDYIGEDIDSKKALFAEAVDINKLALFATQCQTFTGIQNKNGATVNGSIKKQVMVYLQKQNLTAAEKYLILGYLGYTAEGENYVTALLNKTSLSKSQKETILTYCGYN